MEDFIKRMNDEADQKDEPKENPYDLAIMAQQYAKDEVAREKKHLKAYLKGYTKYTHLKRTYQILSAETTVNKPLPLKSKVSDVG